MKVGMIAEATCVGKPFTIMPMVVTQVQDVIAAGQLRPTDQLVDVSNSAPAGDDHGLSRPLFAGRDRSACRRAAAASPTPTPTTTTRSQTEDLGTVQRVFLHVVDTVGLVHAMILRMQALMLPVQTLVLQGH